MRQKPIAAYMENMTRMLLLAHPNLTPAEAEAWVKNKIDERLHRPKIWGLKHKSYGNSSEELTDLLTLTQKHAGNIISPNGCVYMSSDRKVSMIANMIRDMMKNRKREKKAMLKSLVLKYLCKTFFLLLKIVFNSVLVHKTDIM